MARITPRKIVATVLAPATFRINEEPARTHLWSKGIARACDRAGPGTYWRAQTEVAQPEGWFARHYADVAGVVWVRLGTRARNDGACDLDRFVAEALPTIRAPFVLVTTDGDASVPEDFRTKTVAAILGSPWLVRWHSQNVTGRGDPRIVPFPIGLDLHTPRLFTSSVRLAALMNRLRATRTPAGDMPLTVFSDLRLSAGIAPRRAATEALQGIPHVVEQRRRVSQTAIWQCYAGHPFVASAPGNGLDCHRTWEALYLGSIVVMKRSALDPLFEGLAVALIDDWGEVRDVQALRRWQEALAPLTDATHVRARLDPLRMVAAMRAELAVFNGGVR